VVPTTAAVSANFDGVSFPYASTGYNTGVNFTTANGCGPYVMFQKRGVFFDGAAGSMSVTVDNIAFYKNFTVAMWVRPVESDGSLFSFSVNRGKMNGNLFVSSCNGLAASWATTDFTTPKNSLSTTNWSFIAFSAEKADTVVDLLLYVNGV
jgi:hypothetical protein